MIISHKYKFIFLKTTKTAGTSIELALSRFCGEDDIISEVSPADEKLRRQLGTRGPQHHQAVPLAKYSVRDWKRLLRRGRRRFVYYNHMPAREVKALIGNTIWDEYYKFCFERNPWDRAISWYYWRCSTEPRPPISQFIASGALRTLKDKGFGVYAIDGKIAVDRVCRYENLEAELSSVCNTRLQIPEKLALPKAKAGYRRDRRHYRDVLAEADRDRIAQLFADEIELFGYRY